MPKLPRGVSPKKIIALRLPGVLIEALATEETRTGETRTQIVERLLTKGLAMERRYALTTDDGEVIATDQTTEQVAAQVEEYNSDPDMPDYSLNLLLERGYDNNLCLTEMTEYLSLQFEARDA